jgi:hypothetical protein
MLPAAGLLLALPSAGFIEPMAPSWMGKEAGLDLSAGTLLACLSFSPSKGAASELCTGCAQQLAVNFSRSCRPDTRKRRPSKDSSLLPSVLIMLRDGYIVGSSAHSRPHKPYVTAGFKLDLGHLETFPNAIGQNF